MLNSHKNLAPLRLVTSSTVEGGVSDWNFLGLINNVCHGQVVGARVRDMCTGLTLLLRDFKAKVLFLQLAI